MSAIALLDGGGRGLRLGAASRGILRIPHLKGFLGLPEAELVLASRFRPCDLYLGWGTKQSGRLAIELAARHGKPWLLLEDGFLRSVAPQSVSGEPTLSLAIDDRGIYYDSRSPSRLEDLIAASGGLSQQGQGLVAAVRAARLSKYNAFDGDADFEVNEDGILIIDQTFGDQSIAGAQAGEADFSEMLDAAVARYGAPSVTVKLHPEVVAGKKRGYLADKAMAAGCKLLASNINPWSLFERFRTVYTVSSQLGFEALMAGLTVRCFGLPFYAGWGLTQDEKKCPRRQQHDVSIASLAAATLLRYCRYVDPFTGVRSDPFSTLGLLAQWRDLYAANRKLGPFYRISPWKRATVRAMFQQQGRQKTFYWTRAGALRAARMQGRAIVAWAAKIDDAFEEKCEEASIPLYRLEDGFVRSVGLGANFHQPMSLVLDSRGIYYDSRRRSELEDLYNRADFSSDLIDRARSLLRTLIDNDITKYNLEGRDIPFVVPGGRQVILVPGQVEDDASIRFGGANLDTLQTLEAVRRENPHAFVIFKPHPDVTSGQRPGLRDRDAALAFADAYAEGVQITALLDMASEVHTITSLTGFEALLRGRKVVCYGLPFYAGWGLTTDRVPCPRRVRRLTLEELVAGALILYPRYLDPKTMLPCGPELVIRRIEEERVSPTPAPLLIRLRRAQGRLKRYVLNR